MALTRYTIAVRRQTMWDIEVNIAGHQFTGRLPDLPSRRWRPGRLHPRTMRWRSVALRHLHAA
ncbi:hypothetical protein ACAG26_16870 [Mycobacterium sp. pUA109]|uniref:hypothetical protein n=1 Tax=Mycobacterium sp. pUA109 TaxID=3238982 RepID=UPI00351AFDEB